MTSKAQIKASNKYNRENTITLCLRLNKETDKDIIELLNAVKSKQGYIKELIREDLPNWTVISSVYKNR
jgi:hypothetical protein